MVSLPPDHALTTTSARPLPPHPQVEFLTTDRILNQFYKKFVLGEKSEYIDDDGNVIKRPDAQYDELGVKTQY